VRLDLGQGDLVKGAKRRGSRSDANEKKRDHQSHIPSRDRTRRFPAAARKKADWRLPFGTFSEHPAETGNTSLAE
jgi:hypothetical protein